MKILSMTSLIALTIGLTSSLVAQVAVPNANKNEAESKKPLLESLTAIQEKILRPPTNEPIETLPPPFFSFKPESNFPRLIFEEVNHPSTSVNIANYARNPVGNERQPTNEIPGILTTQSYALFDSTQPMTYRGAGVRYLMDGVPLARIPRGGADLNYLPAFDDVQRIDFYNSSSTSLGTGGTGTINYLTRNPDTDTAFRLKTNHLLGSEELYATNNSVEGTVDRWGYLLTYSQRQWDGPRHNSDYFLTNSGTKVQFHATENQLWTFGAFSTDYEQGVPSGLTTNQYNTDRDMQNRGRDREWNTKGTGYLKTNLRFSEESGAEIIGYGGIEDRTTRDQTGTNQTASSIREQAATTVGVRAKVFKFWEAWGDQQNFNAGFDFDHYKNVTDNSSTTRLSLNDTRGVNQIRQLTQGGGFYFQNEFNFGKLHLTPGARLDVYSLTGSERYNTTLNSRTRPLKDHTLTYVVPKISFDASYELLNKTSLFMSVMNDHDNLAPDHAAAGSNIFVDPNLKPSAIWKYETGVRGQIRPWVDYSGGFFLLDRDDQILTMTNNGVSRFENARRSLEKGLEGQFRIVLTHMWQDLIEERTRYEPSAWGDFALSGNFSVLDSEHLSGDNTGRQVAFSPDFLIKGGVYYNYQDRFKANLTGTWAEEYFASDDNVSQSSTFASNTPTFMVWDLNAEYWVIKNRFRLMAGIHNLFDEDYYGFTGGNTFTGGIDPAPQRNYYGGIGIVF